LKSKGSRPVLATLGKSDPNATPKTKEQGVQKAKPKPLTSKLGPTVQTPRPMKKVQPKSIKKAMSIYTPARPTEAKTEQGENEVEHTHPKPPGQSTVSYLVG
jgi:hypothetical protein